MVALAHVEAPRVADVIGIGEIDILLGTHGFAAVARLFERNAALVALGHVNESAAVRPEQPLIGWKHDEIRIECAHIEIEHSGALRCVDQEDCAAGAHRARDGGDV